MLLGLFLLIIGIILLLKNLGIIVISQGFWSVVGPVILILLGIYIMSVVQRGRQYRNWLIKRFWGTDDDTTNRTM